MSVSMYVPDTHTERHMHAYINIPQQLTPVIGAPHVKVHVQHSQSKRKRAKATGSNYSGCQDRISAVWP